MASIKYRTCRSQKDAPRSFDDNIEFVEPNDGHDVMMADFIEEFKINDEKSIPASLDYFNFKNYQEWLKIIKILNQNNSYREYLPAKTFFIMTKLQNEITGLIQFRPILNEYLNIFGGHIGYSIKPSKRKLGYASIAMMKMLNYIKSHSDLKEIIMTTSQNNLASRKIIITNGGQLIGKQFDLKQGKIVYRYKISLNE